VKARGESEIKSEGSTRVSPYAVTGLGNDEVMGDTVQPTAPGMRG